MSCGCVLQSSLPSMFFNKSTWVGLVVFFAASQLLFTHCISDAVSKPITHFQVPLTPIDTPMQAFLDDYRTFFMDGMASTQTPGAAVVIVKGDSIIFLQGFGVRNQIHQKGCRRRFPRIFLWIDRC